MHEDRLKQMIGEVLQTVAPEAQMEQLDPAVNFRDQLDIDSVDFLTFVLALEKRSGIHIPEIDCPKLSSLNGCLSYLLPHVQG